MPMSDIKVGALKFSEFYTWGFRAVGQFFYGRQLIEAGLNQRTRSKVVVSKNAVHFIKISGGLLLWGFQSTFLRRGTAMLNLKSNYCASTKHETNPDYIRKDAHAQKVAIDFASLSSMT